MTKKIALLVVFVFAGLISNCQVSQSFTTNTVGSVYVIEGEYWFFTYDNIKVLSPPQEVNDGRTETRKEYFAGQTQQACFDKILMLFGPAELARIQMQPPEPPAPPEPVMPVPPMPDTTFIIPPDPLPIPE